MTYIKKQITYTKRQRRAIYLEAVKLIELGRQNYCCIALKSITYYMFNYDKVFPEFYLFNPGICILSAWWEHNDRESRINALVLCAEMCR